MKKILSIISLALIAGVSQAQVVFSSDLSSWSGGEPTDFGGDRTHTSNLTITEVTEGSEYGSSNARLETAVAGEHRRFSTQHIEVTADQGYQMKVWAKGQGDLRFGLYDNRPGESAGYSSYSAYNTLNSTSLVEYTYDVLCTNSAANGEFIISVRNTVGSAHIEIDSVSITMIEITPPTAIGIYEIQYTTDPTGDSPLKDQVVMTGGIVTAIRTDGRYWIQNGNGPWKGIYVYHQPTVPVQLGDSVTFSATVTEYFNLTELSFINDYVNVSSGNFFMATNASTVQANSEAYEGCLIRVSNANCTTALNNFNEWIVNDGSGPVKIDDFLYLYTPTVGQAYNVTGILDYGFSEYKILPRDANDVSTAIIGVDEVVGANLSIYPVPAQDMITIQFETSVPQEVMVTDAAGKQMERFLSNGTTRLNIENYISGLYFINVNGHAYRFVKQ